MPWHLVTTYFGMIYTSAVCAWKHLVLGASFETVNYFLYIFFQGLFIPLGVLTRGSYDVYYKPWLCIDMTTGNMEKRGGDSHRFTRISRMQKVLTRGWWDPKRGKRSNVKQVISNSSSLP